MRGPIVWGAGPRPPRAAWMLFFVGLLALGTFVALWIRGGAPGAVPLTAYVLAQAAQRYVALRHLERSKSGTPVRPGSGAVSSRA